MEKSQWQKITIESRHEMLASISGFLVGTIEAGVERAAPEEAGQGKIIAFLKPSNTPMQEREPLSDQVSTYLSEVASTFSLPVPSYIIEQIDEGDWTKRWKGYLKPFANCPWSHDRSKLGGVYSATWGTSTHNGSRIGFWNRTPCNYFF